MKYKKASANILVFNCGSSSLKYRLISMPQEQELISGEAERVGIKAKNSSSIKHSVLGKERVLTLELSDHTAAFKKVIELIEEDCKADKHLRFNAFAHRYVHPGNYFKKTIRINKSVLKKLKDTLVLAPIHNPISYKLIELCSKEFPKVPQFAIFDTAFHCDIPKEFSTYAINSKIAKKYGLKRIGFHGISHEYVLHKACGFLKRNPKLQKVISCHLGTGGASICAINAGKSINSSMGFTPLEGLMMNTRSGDMDLGLFFYIMFKEGLSRKQAEEILNKKSGVLGVFNASSDLNDAFKSIDEDGRAKMVFDMYVRRVKKYIGFYELILKKADILIFTDSLGAGLFLLRENVCKGLECFGVFLDKKINREYHGGIRDISSKNSQTRILIVPTNEEIMIARQAYKEYCHGFNS
ncbi:MAG: acetate/propionate family kinase [Candidatus Omnitrophica bacterium]|nr:acetate/propionate family kinase [Candidatus Omnitrophota bacterium]